MIENTQNTINIKKLNETQSSLDSINTLLNRFTLEEEFDYLSKELNTLNFEHGNLFPNYQIYLNKIYNRINDIKKDILSLENSIEDTVKDVDKIEVLSDDSIANDISNSIVENLDDIPVGLGIAATGITAAIGTHLVDNGEKELKELPKNEKEKPKNDDFNFDIDYDEPDDTLDFLTEKKEEPPTPYEAKRKITSLEEFYENDDK